MDSKFTKFEGLLNNLDYLITEEARAIVGGRLELLESINKKKNAFIFALCQDDFDCAASDFNEKISSIISNLEYNYKKLNTKIKELKKSVENNKTLLNQLKKLECPSEATNRNLSCHPALFINA